MTNAHYQPTSLSREAVEKRKRRHADEKNAGAHEREEQARRICAGLEGDLSRTSFSARPNEHLSSDGFGGGESLTWGLGHHLMDEGRELGRNIGIQVGDRSGLLGAMA